MPVYSYKCRCGERFDRFLRLSEYQRPQYCKCGLQAEKQLAAPAVRGDYPPYTCPITGQVIEGRRAHQENLARHGCRVLESGEVEQARRVRAEAELHLEESVAETAAQIVHSMDSESKAALGQALESSEAQFVNKTGNAFAAT